VRGERSVVDIPQGIYGGRYSASPARNRRRSDETAALSADRASFSLFIPARPYSHRPYSSTISATSSDHSATLRLARRLSGDASPMRDNDTERRTKRERTRCFGGILDRPTLSSFFSRSCDGQQGYRRFISIAIMTANSRCYHLDMSD